MCGFCNVWVCVFVGFVMCVCVCVCVCVDFVMCEFAYVWVLQCVGVCMCGLGMIGRNKSVGPDGIPGAILKKMGGEAMILYLARLLDIRINNGTIPKDWKKIHCFSYSQRRRSFGSQKPEAGQFNLSVMQTNGTRYFRLYTTSVGRLEFVIRGPT